MRAISRRLLFILIAPSLVSGVLAQSSSSILGKTDFESLSAALPTMPASPSGAAVQAYGPDVRTHDVNLDSVYQPFFDKASAARQQLHEAIQARRHQIPDQAAVAKQAKADANANPIVAGMGGTDKIEQMTPDQRKAAALQSAQTYQQNLTAKAGRGSPEMQAMMQKMMSDPQYRARFMQMSDAEKEAAIRNAMGASASAPAIADSSQPAATSNPAANAIAVRHELDQWRQQIGVISADFARKDEAVSLAKGSHDDIARDISARIAKVPVIELGEYGHDRDPEKVIALQQEQAALDRQRAEWELKQRAALESEQRQQLKQLATSYENWLKQNSARINTSIGDPLHNTDTELDLAGYEDQLITMFENLAKYGQNATKEAARYEKTYQEKASGNSPAVTVRASKKKS